MAEQQSPPPQMQHQVPPTYEAATNPPSSHPGSNGVSPAPQTPQQTGYLPPKAGGPQHQDGPINMQPMGNAPMNQNDPNTRVTPLHMLSLASEWIDCHFCHQRTKTRVDQQGGGLQFLTGALLCLVCICLAPLPCCLGWFEETHWYCTGCGREVAYQAKDMPIHVIPPPEARIAQSQYTGQPGFQQQPQQQQQPGQQYPMNGPASPPPAHLQQQPMSPPPQQGPISPASTGVVGAPSPFAPASPPPHGDGIQPVAQPQYASSELPTAGGNPAN